MATAKRTYYLNADKSKALPAKSVKAGEDDSPEGAAYLLVRAGGAISDEDVAKYGVPIVKEGEAEAESPSLILSGTADSGPALVESDRPLESPKAAKRGK